ncbi:endonuclease/exonuclease/phosphatase family protein [Pontiella desulfatans]|uniref:endonuclease/exonuclease/phosphatase family protein n=1 Tax=Pontiella desulfatans TaxID=2750659 RepID=UPI001443C423|nr:endonuclease/exonuclease/phosphatase family protein [Pontiella desulfatans]
MKRTGRRIRNSKLSACVFLGFLCFILPTGLHADHAVLAGWHDFSSAFQAHRWLNSAKEAVSDLDQVSGSLYGGDGARNTWGSTDGTYGPAVETGSTAADGAMSIRVDKNTIHFSVSNGTSRNIHLDKVVFDFASINGNSPRNLELYYDSGDLADPDGTLLMRWTSILNGLASVSDYEDKELDLSLLGDQILGPGEEAVFRFQVDTANVNNQALGLDNIAILGGYADFAILTYNIHGGYGPDGEGTPQDNLTAFRNTFMNGEDVLCLQEVDNGDCWTAVQSVFLDYPYRFRTVNQETDYWPWETPKQTSIAILSKHPFLSTDEELIQTDPQYDQWERHAQHVAIQLGASEVDLFHFHNTYNFNDNDWEYEKSGLTRFRDYVYNELGIGSLGEAENLIMLGDFNLLHTNVAAILDTPDRKSDGRDHICSVPHFTSSGKYATVSADLSDHPALWAALDLQAPAPDPMQWASAPAANGASALSMEAAAASDPYEVEYYFSNTTIADGSHDSGWQNSPTYLDSDLTQGTTYSYTVTARDKSANANATQPSAAASAVAIINYIVPPYAESFEDGSSGDWVQVRDDDYDWTVNSGGTTTAASGPSGASDGSYYLYAEGHHGLGLYKTASVVAYFDLSGLSAPVMKFDYHMYGEYIDHLSLDVHDGASWTSNVWTKSRQQHTGSDDPWSTATVDLSAYSATGKIKLRFRTANLLWNAADPAIDHILVEDALGTTYALWADAAFSNAPPGTDETFGGNPDSDRFNNRQEWALALNPLVADQPAVELAASNATFVAIYRRRNNTGLSVDTVWASALTSAVWRGVGDGLTELILETNDHLETVAVQVATDEDRKFIQIKVSE